MKRNNVITRLGASIVIVILMTLMAYKRYDNADHNKPYKKVPELPFLFDFDAKVFENPPLEFGPFTRWWWPGNDVTTKELKREMQLFAENKFGGVEIQPITVGINPEGKRLNKVYSWDTPSFYTNVETVMKEALKTGLTVDMNGGSGWPIGGPFVKPDESLLTLDVADTVVNGGVKLNIAVPTIKTDKSTLLRQGKVIYNKVDLSLAKLHAIAAAKILKTSKGRIQLDPSTTVVLNGFVNSGKLQWTVPQGGQWKILAFYALPDGEKPLHQASNKASWVADHLDSNALQKSYKYLFGERTGLTKYYGKPFRAIFNDSKEFITGRHISKDFIQYFKANRGYDASPWLAVNAISAYNNAYSFGRDSISKYTFSNEDWRLRYDYDLTVLELYKQHFLNGSRNWMEKRGLQHRTQEYGIRTDVIGASGLASIPETEQLFGEGSEGITKLVTSGAHLYNRPIISQESFVFRRRAGMTTPQKIKAFANKSFAAGVNQIIYHGTPYKYQTGEYGIEGWNTWASPFKAGNYSSNINESYNYWKYIKDINTFIARSQYALRSGKPKADVLIYFPFINFEVSQTIKNPEETFVEGHFNDLEPMPARSFGSYAKKPTVIQKWFMDVWPLINKLESMGITWDYVNDESLLVADVGASSIQIRDNDYGGLIIPNVPYMRLEVVKHIEALASRGIKLLIFGDSPAQQPSFLDYKQNDLKVKQSFTDILKNLNVSKSENLKAVESWTEELKGPIRYNNSYTFLRQIQREMNDGSRIQFLWNKTNQVKIISLTLDKKYNTSYWLNPEDGSIIKNERKVVNFELQPFSSIILYASTKQSISNKALNNDRLSFSDVKEVVKITNWNIKAGKQSLQNSVLFDWRNNDLFKYLSEEGTYTSTFHINKKKDKKYLLELGDVYFSAEVWINGKQAGRRIWPPYQLDVTDFLKNNTNTVKVLVTPTNRNFYVGERVKGNPKYTWFVNKNFETTLMPAGLVGPVIIKECTVL